MSFQPIKKRRGFCKDFRQSLWREGCKYSDECEKEGFQLVPNSNHCTGIKMPPRPKVTPRPSKKG